MSALYFSIVLMSCDPASTIRTDPAKLLINFIYTCTFFTHIKLPSIKDRGSNGQFQNVVMTKCVSSAQCLTLLSSSVPLQSSSISVTCWVSLNMGTPRSEGPRPSSVEPSYRQRSPKPVTTYTPGWPVCRVQQVSVYLQVFVSVLICWSSVLSYRSVLLLSGNPLSLVDLVPLLQKTLKDESSVTCKMACSAVRVRLICASLLVFCPPCVWAWPFFVCSSIASWPYAAVP